MRREVLYSILCTECYGTAFIGRYPCVSCHYTGLSLDSIQRNLQAQVEPQGITQSQHDLDRPRRVRWIEIKRGPADSAR